MLNCCISTLFLGVPLTPQVVFGVLLVVSSTFLFNGKGLPFNRGAERAAVEGELSPLNEYGSADEVGGQGGRRAGR